MAHLVCADQSDPSRRDGDRSAREEGSGLIIARRIVVAPDSFKGSATAVEVAESIAAGWRSVSPIDELVLRPMADGGEGTLDAIVAAVPGARRISITVDGPDDRLVHTHWGFLPPTPELPGGVGVVELANTSGLGLLDPPRPFDAHTRGFGQAIAAALEAGVSQLRLAIGGSSSTDGGVGALRALGGRFADASGTETFDGNAGLADLARIDLTRLPALPSGGVVTLTDVRSPLLGPTGAAGLFGEQKGAGHDDLPALEEHLAQLLDLVAQSRTDAVALSEAPGAGAAGGTGFGLSLWGATSSSGADSVATLIGLQEAIRTAALVITGEGRFDAQTGEGKVVGRVKALADSNAVPTALVAGLISAEPVGFAVSAALTELAGSSETAYAHPLLWARAAGAMLAERFGG